MRRQEVRGDWASNCTTTRDAMAWLLPHAVPLLLEVPQPIGTKVARYYLPYVIADSPWPDHR